MDAQINYPLTSDLGHWAFDQLDHVKIPSVEVQLSFLGGVVTQACLQELE